nr:putative membrane protein YfcA [Mucilaginibacter sp. SP1R1]
MSPVFFICFIVIMAAGLSISWKNYKAGKIPKKSFVLFACLSVVFVALGAFLLMHSKL